VLKNIEENCRLFLKPTIKPGFEVIKEGVPEILLSWNQFLRR
jgi:hypothetical protein